MRADHDLYGVLGLSNTATLDQIKKAYRTLALKHHTDRGGEKEKITSINEAYQILGDAAKKKAYDSVQSSGADAIDRMFQNQGEWAKLDSTGERFSERYRKCYMKFYHENALVLPVPFNVNNVIPPHQSTLFDVTDQSGNMKEGGLFDFLKLYAASYSQAGLPAGVCVTPITPAHAVGLMINFVEGDFRGNQLKQLYEYLMQQSAQTQPREQLLYHAIANIIHYAYRETVLNEFQRSRTPMALSRLHESLGRITNYIKQTASFSMTYCASLLQNEYFRDFYQWALVNTLWRQPRVDMIQKTLSAYSNHDETRDELVTLMERFERLQDDSEHRSGVEQWLITYKYLYIYEKNAKEQREKQTYLTSADHHIEYAYDIVDWVPALSGRVPREILANLFLQAGSQMQVAGELSTHYRQQMACEKLSFEFYMNALMLGNRSALDTELYVLQHIISNISAYRYEHKSAKTLLPDIVKLYSNIVNVFPLYEEPQSHIRFFSTRDDGLQGAMRRMLYVFVDIIKHNRSHEMEMAKPFDHKYADVLYYAYEACLRRWYESSEETEKNIRVNLMDELLAEKGWKFSDLNKRLQSPHIMIARTAQGWLSPSRTLALPLREQQTAFAALDAVEVNQDTGDLNFVMRDITGWQDPQQRVISFSDIQEIFSHNVTGALLSLDEVNEHMRFHPFNQIRVAPTSLFATDFINTFLLTDYFLKFMTVGHEVNGQYPYQMRPVQEMIAYLPTHLKLIIEQFQGSNTEESAHRFWIEACPVNAFIPVEEGENRDETTRIMVPEIRMIVKKHLLRRSATGAMVDDPNEPGEGWHFYRFHLMPRGEVLQTMAADKSLIVFGLNLREIYFVPEGGQPERVVLHNHLVHYFTKISAMDVDNAGAISRTNENTSYLYYVVKTLCQEYKKPNLFSPEYVFAQEFTLHYNEFANFLPEFARLRELSRLTVYVQLLNRVKHTQDDRKTRLETLLNDATHWRERQRVINTAINGINQQYDRVYNEASQETTTQITQIFNDFNRDFSRPALERKYRERLRDLKIEIEPLDFTENSREVVDAIESTYQENKKRIIREHGTAQWNHSESSIRSQCNAKKRDYASEFTKSKREAIHKQLLDQYDSMLSIPRRTISDYVTEFMNGNSTHLHQSLVENSYTKSLKTQTESLASFGIAERTVERALTNINDRNTIIRAIVDKNTENLRRQRDSELQRLNGIIAEEKSELRTLIAKTQRVIDKLSGLGIGRDASLDQTTIPAEQCTWVPASVDSHENRTRLVYGGVHIQPSINVQTRMTPQTQTAVNTCYSPSNHFRYSAQDLPRANQSGQSNNYQQRMTSQSYTPPPAPPSGGFGGGGGGYGGGSSGGGGGSSGAGDNRFTYIVQNVSRAEARVVLQSGNCPLSLEQIKKVRELLSKGAATSVTIKVTQSGDVRLASERPGKDNGFQRMSFSVNLDGRTTRVVQTAFDDNNDLVRQRPDQSKNNLYDVKHVKK